MFFFTILESFISLRIKTKAFQTTQCNADKDSFKLILNNSFFNILKYQKKTESSPQHFHNNNTFFIKAFFLTESFQPNVTLGMQVFLHSLAQHCTEYPLVVFLLYGRVQIAHSTLRIFRKQHQQ